MLNLRRYTRAFIIALRMTLRGEKPVTAEALFPKMVAWCRETVARVAALQALAANIGSDIADRALQVEGRTMRGERILETIAYHARTEYPHLLVREGQYAKLAINASNYNDRFYLTRLHQSGENAPFPPELEQAIMGLIAHLTAIPQEERTETSASA